MLRNKKYFAVVLLMLGSCAAFAQVTTQSPYSKFGLGNIKGSLLPQFRAMGGVSTAINRTNGYSNINISNPASYAGIILTTVDAGMSGGFVTLKKGSDEDKSFNATFSHLAIAFPIASPSGKSLGGLSVGILPYSELGYEFTNSVKIDTMDVNYIYNGEGGLTKAYLGYGFQIGPHFRLGANFEYLFGNLIQAKTTTFLNQATSFNSRMQDKNHVYGVAFSYGAQYDIVFNDKMILTLGYSGSSSSSLNTRNTSVVTRFTRDADGNENVAIPGDTLQMTENAPNKLKLPLVHNFGIALQKFNSWVIGADFRMGNWSDLTINGVNQGLQDSYGFSVGGSITPNASAVSGYFNHVDYRFGFQYDKTYVQLSNTDIKQTSVSIGFGLPFSSISRYTFSKLNFTAEMGKRGTLSSSLIKENFINFHLGITLNDKWFNRFHFD